MIIYINMLLKVELFEGTSGRQEREKDGRIISKYIASVYEDAITKHTESCGIMGKGRYRHRINLQQS
jgi:hypothetical protein